MRNGLYYVKKAGRGGIDIRLSRGKEFNQLIFEDTGTGIPPQYIDRIFERFFTTSETGHGAGIGLSFCKLTMRGIGGDIRCESVFGMYTRFTLDFPKVCNE
ncbi:MAG: HAMP domain-containing histidine kinase [Gammaproteobacteria bacterium]|nr:HAMP domain-containing histidine kinase [Gammaproteobacteria bacterium]